MGSPPSREFARLQKKIERLQSELDGPAYRRRLKEVGKKVEPYVGQAIRQDGLSDQSMSGWPRKNPMVLDGYSALSSSVSGGIFVAPGVKGGNWKNALGPMRVLQDGRKAYTKGDRRQKGTRVRKKTGETVATFRKVKRNLGATKGKETWTHAEQLININIARHVYETLVQAAIRSWR
jgi:hypothetical protein